MRIILLFITLIIAISSCSTLNTVLQAKQNGEGTTQVYEVGFEEAWTIAKKSYRWAGADAIEEYKDEGYMLTSKGQDWVSSGSVMGTWVKDLGNGSCEVTCISKRRISTDFATGMTESKYHKYFAKGAEIVQSSNSLPLAAPKV